jgi:hypothetical protein
MRVAFRETEHNRLLLLSGLDLAAEQGILNIDIMNRCRYPRARGLLFFCCDQDGPHK